MKVFALARRHPVAAYFGIAYALSAIALLLVDGPTRVSSGATGAASALLAFPLMVAGLGLAAFALTGVVD